MSWLHRRRKSGRKEDKQTTHFGTITKEKMKQFQVFVSHFFGDRDVLRCGTTLRSRDETGLDCPYGVVRDGKRPAVREVQISSLARSVDLSVRGGV